MMELNAPPFELDAVVSHSQHMRYPLHSRAHTHAPRLRLQLEHVAILTALYVLYDTVHVLKMQ